MDYLMFTYPDCSKCETLKEYLKSTNLAGREYELSEKESRLKIREYLSVIKRDDKGSVILPVLILREGGGVLGVFNTPQELASWLGSKA